MAGSGQNLTRRRPSRVDPCGGLADAVPNWQHAKCAGKKQAEQYRRRPAGRRRCAVCDCHRTRPPAAARRSRAPAAPSQSATGAEERERVCPGDPRRGQHSKRVRRRPTRIKAIWSGATTREGPGADTKTRDTDRSLVARRDSRSRSRSSKDLFRHPAVGNPVARSASLDLANRRNHRHGDSQPVPGNARCAYGRRCHCRMRAADSRRRLLPSRTPDRHRCLGRDPSHLGFRNSQSRFGK